MRRPESLPYPPVPQNKLVFCKAGFQQIVGTMGLIYEHGLDRQSQFRNFNFSRYRERIGIVGPRGWLFVKFNSVAIPACPPACR